VDTAPAEAIAVGDPEGEAGFRYVFLVGAVVERSKEYSRAITVTPDERSEMVADLLHP
jgi:hypothetical protein